jgi:hypothetical protein
MGSHAWVAAAAGLEVERTPCGGAEVGERGEEEK